jgi:SsrA-binding protein
VAVINRFICFRVSISAHLAQISKGLTTSAQLKDWGLLVVKELGKKVIAQNKSARHDYFIEEVYECGLVLTGTEVKSLRAGRASLTDGYAMAKDGEIWVSGIHIPEYNQGSWTNHPPRRDRKLLLHKREIAQISGVIKQGGLTLIPLSLYFKDGKAKVEIAVAKGKKAHDKRNTLMERQSNREIEREVSNRRSGKSN